MVCAWRNFQKNSCAISTTYDKNFKPQISSIFHFDWVSDNGMAHVLGVKTNLDFSKRSSVLHTYILAES